MPLLVVGTSHQTAPLEVRERVAFSGRERIHALRDLVETPGIEEAVLISTCNRTEVYALVSPEHQTVPHEWLRNAASLEPDQAARCLYQKHNSEAVEHLFRVASGLESLVLGEPQILGQLKDAWRAARDAGSLGKITDRLFQRAFAAGKAVRSETGIATHAVSVAYIATLLARQIFGDLGSKTVLLVGAGEMIELCGHHFHDQGIGQLAIANRSRDRAEGLARRFDATSLGLDEVEAYLPRVDILVSSTASPLPIITLPLARNAMQQRRRKPMFMVDIAVPRDVAPEVADLDGIYLYTIDDLQQVADENMAQRREAADTACHSVRSAVEEYMRWLHGTRAADSLRRLRAHAEASGDELARRAARQLRAGHDPEAVVGQLANTLTHRVLHGPTKRLREAAEHENYEMLRAADWLFDASLDPLPDEEDEFGPGTDPESTGKEPE
ncbi:MAG: glutamyl-tRNA reductase [Xanthomonadales bacterium]|nr:glutamyl-tRNA reductase [Xanthomonadales bacterium]